MLDPKHGHRSLEERSAAGKAARGKAPRSSHADWAPAADRADPVELLEGQATSRVGQLVPLRYARMLVSPFTFYRGAAAVMAADLAATPRSGFDVQLCGDAHLSNFGAFASPDRELVFDVNDFDETLPGPWEWDVMRLAASFSVAGRASGFKRRVRGPGLPAGKWGSRCSASTPTRHQLAAVVPVHDPLRPLDELPRADPQPGSRGRRPGLSTDEAVRQGISATAGTVTSAAVVMVAVFSIFATLSIVDMKEMGVGLAVAVLLDATIVRGVLLPAAMKLLGERNWYLPRGLRWLPRGREPEPAPARG
jgi:hypothetical protein